jgi:hypothetical protein
MLLEGSRNGGLSRRREAGEPDGGALLLAELAALLAAKALVPCDVARWGIRSEGGGVNTRNAVAYVAMIYV